jgi:hypothetical protein
MQDWLTWTIGMEGNFAGDGDAGLVRAEIVVTVIKTERFSERAELASGVRVEETLGLGVVGNALVGIKRG